jgi:DnaJ-class molecular chaperone
MVTADKGSEKRPVECPTCEGTGFMRPTGVLAKLLGFKTALCKDCDGSGWVDRPEPAP